MAPELKNHTVTAFDQDLKKITASLYDMNLLVTDSMRLFKQSISNQAAEYIVNVRDIDDKINELEKQVEKLSTNIIALRHPMAVDLRFVISAIKVSTMVERQGDIIEKAVRKIPGINPKLLPLYQPQLDEIANIIIEMLTHAIKG
ncbi:MAG: PhoU domain-containing protein, partial [Rickettsiales bacterium]|nr:PhoU domain-containing protein [Rickettsiales bacterium]